MTPEESRRCGHQLIDWIAEYREQIEQMPVRAQVKPGAIKKSMPASPPGQQIAFEALLEQN